MDIDHQNLLNENNFAKIVKTADGSLTIYCPVVDQNYHCIKGAKSEMEELYLNSSGFCQLLRRHKEKIVVLDVGLGLGYNALGTLDCWSRSEAECDLLVISLENNAKLLFKLLSNQAPWAVDFSLSWKSFVNSVVSQNSAVFEGRVCHKNKKNTASWSIFLGDAIESLMNKVSDEFIQFIWQDPFSPEKNPALWSSEWFNLLAKKSSKNAIIATYSCARVVKKNLDSSGWQWQTIPAHPIKRNWLIARKSLV